ncbi:hypothetical protein BGX21_000979 [Mortierella sp. AD011]|nr:hypothetical protein BGX20_007344 [Mortierella sp. AD010]KAF9401665.1 hypothetical protein BGX21_000979 [Mortierella sp. AD011]
MNAYPSQPPPISLNGKTPHVVIVGAGLAGLFLAILLDLQGVPYEIYERAKAIRPLGGVMSLNANILPVFEQLGLLEELKSISLPTSDFHVYKSNMKLISAIEGVGSEELVGYDYQLFARPNLYDIFLARIPPGRLHLNKKVMSIAQGREGVMIRCSDGTTYHGDILVGADGAYSGVRQSLYKMLQAENLLPESDMRTMGKGFSCLVGTTDPLDPEKYPILKNKRAILYQIVGDRNQYTWSAVNVPDNRICWNVVSQFASISEAEDEKFRNSEWGSGANEGIINEVKDFLVPIGGAMGDLISATQPDTISRVILEDKIFKTWSYKRVVLIGDACHKLLPSAGQGAVNALQDAVILANCIYDLESLLPGDISAALEDYRHQRYPHVVEQYDASKINAKIIYGQTAFEKLIRNVVLNYLPKSVQAKNAMKNLAYRPQATFLPLVPKRGKGPVLPQKPSKRYEAEQNKARARVI